MKSLTFSKNQKLRKLLRYSPVKKYIVEGQSMLPTLSPGMTVLATRIFFSLEKGDLVAVCHPKTSTIMIKRVEKIGKDGIEVRGDNVAQSTDSRQFGPVSRKHIIAKVFSFW